jgi:signal transduction histidine kinase
MIRLSVRLKDMSVRSIEWTQDTLSCGRASDNNIVITADNVSGHHSAIVLAGDHYIFRDLKSTNGSLIVRGEETIYLREGQLEAPICEGDKLCLASLDNMLIVEEIRIEGAGFAEPDKSTFDQTILAECSTEEEILPENELSDDFEGLRQTVRMTRELVVLQNPKEISDLVCKASLQAFPRATRVIYLVLRGECFGVDCVHTRDGEMTEDSSKLMQPRELLDRCLKEHKGFLFLIQKNEMQAVATMIMPMEKIDSMSMDQDRIIMCCPMFHQDQCYGFLNVEAAMGHASSQNLTRRDLSLASLMCHIVAARLHELETQNERLKLARKATAGFMSATVGHCFKNLLFVPMMISRMLPVCLQQNQMEQVEWMLARNAVTIRYLDILSNEFAAASKDPTEGFMNHDMKDLLEEVKGLLSGIAPDKVEVKLELPDGLEQVYCHGAAFTRLLMNLTLNAVDAFFGEEGREELGIVELSAVQEGGWFCCTVKDNGPGMPEAILENLKLIYQQVMSSADALSELQTIAERVQSTKDQGLKEHYGLGFLFVCQTIMHHGGRMRIQSEPGQGARFDIAIPNGNTGD